MGRGAWDFGADFFRDGYLSVSCQLLLVEMGQGIYYILRIEKSFSAFRFYRVCPSLRVFCFFAHCDLIGIRNDRALFRFIGPGCWCVSLGESERERQRETERLAAEPIWLALRVSRPWVVGCGLYGMG